MYAKILWKNKLIDNDGNPAPTITATGTMSGYDVQNIANWKKYEKWKAPDNLADYYIDIDAGSGYTLEADHIAFYGHNLNTRNHIAVTKRIKVYADSFTPPTTERWNSDNGYIRFKDDYPNRIAIGTFTSADYRYWRVRFNISAVTSETAELGILFLGNAILFDEPLPPPFDPEIQAPIAEMQRSEGGVLLGSSLKYMRKRFTIRLGQAGMDGDGTFEGNFHTFWMDHARLMKPFFFHWNLDEDTESRRQGYLCVARQGQELYRPYLFSKARKGLQLNVEAEEEVNP